MPHGEQPYEGPPQPSRLWRSDLVEGKKKEKVDHIADMPRKAVESPAVEILKPQLGTLLDGSWTR